jgi:hypothetical protein
MAHVEEGGDPSNVPLVYYDANGNRHLLGEATVVLRGGQLRAVGVFNDIPEALDIGDLGMGHYSVKKDNPPTTEESRSAFQRYMEDGLNG